MAPSRLLPGGTVTPCGMACFPAHTETPRTPGPNSQHPIVHMLSTVAFTVARPHATNTRSYEPDPFLCLSSQPPSPLPSSQIVFKLSNPFLTRQPATHLLST